MEDIVKLAKKEDGEGFQDMDPGEIQKLNDTALLSEHWLFQRHMWFLMKKNIWKKEAIP